MFVDGHERADVKQHRAQLVKDYHEVGLLLFVASHRCSCKR